MSSCYVYGVVEREVAGRDLGPLPAVGDDPEVPVTFVTQGDLAAPVSDLRADRTLGTADDLRVHARVLDTVAAAGAPVVPFRFGAVLPDERAVSDDVLAGGHDAFAAALERLRGRAQFTLRAEYEPDAVLREVLAEHPELAERSRTADPGERERLAELLTGAVEARRATDADLVHGSLASLALAARTAEPAGEDGLVDASFLVEDARRGEFAQAVEELARDWQGRVSLLLLGPLAPYDFAADAFPHPNPAW